MDYNSLLRDDDFLNDAYKSLTSLGYQVSTKRGDILDKFLQNRRYFETNLASTITQGGNIKDLDDVGKQRFARALNKVEQLPSIFSSGSAPKWKALKDYAIAGVSDPTNLLSIIAGAFTLGSGSAVGFGAKEAAKQGTKAALKAKWKLLGTKPVLKAMAVEGTIAGAGGAEQARRSQQTDMELGRREKGDYDAGQIALQALLEGVGSPAFGAGINLGGTASRLGIEKLGDVSGINNSQFAKNTQHFLEKWFMPAAGLDETSLRNIEMSQGEFKTIKAQAEDVSEDIDSAFNRDFKNSEEEFFIEDRSKFADLDADEPYAGGKTVNSIDLINSAMEGDQAALDIVKTRSPDMATALEKFRGLEKQIRAKIKTDDRGMSDVLKNIFKKQTTYTRNVMAKYTQAQREPLQEFLKKNPEVFPEFKKLLLDEDSLEQAQSLGLKDIDGNLIGDEILRDKIIQTELKNQYDPKLANKSRFGTLKSRNDGWPDVLKKIWGFNVNPAIRATQTIAGILEPIADLRMASGLASSLESRGLAFVANSAEEAAAKSGDPNARFVPLISNKAEISKQQYKETPFSVRGDIYSDDLRKIYVDARTADKIKVMTDRTGFLSKNEFLGPFAQAFAAAQGYMKKGKTVYSGFAHARNLLGALQSVAASGNYRGIGKLAKNVLKLSKTERDAFFEKMNDLGVSGTNVELNQIMTRLSDLGDISEDNLKGLSGWMARNIVRGTSLGISSLEKTKYGRKTARALEKLYTKTDDFGKAMTFLSERDKAQKMFDEMTPEQQVKFRDQYSEAFADRLPQVKPPSYSQSIRMIGGTEINIKKEFIDGTKIRNITPKRISKLKNKFEADYQKRLKEYDSKLLDEFASEKTLNVMPVYSRIPRILEKMRGIPVIGSFTAFPAENLRNKYNVLKLGALEIRDGFEIGNSALIKTGANRLLSQGTVASAPIAAAYVYNEVNDTDKVMPFVRESFPEWARYHALQIRKFKNKEGEDEYGVTDLSYNNPDQFVLDIVSPLMVAAANGEDVSENLDKLFKDVIVGVSQPFVDKSLALQFGEQMLGFIRSDNPQIASEYLAKAYKIAEPGVIKNLREMAGDAGAYQTIDKLYQKVGDATPGSFIQSRLEPLYYGEKRRYFKDATSLAGYLAESGLVGNNIMFPYNVATRETILNPKKQLGFAVKTLMGSANSNFNINSREIKKRLQDTQANFTLKGMLDLYKEALEEQYVAQQGIHKLANTLSAFTPRNEIIKMLRSKKIKQAGGLSDREILNIVDGRFVAPQFDKSFLKSLKRSHPEIRDSIPYIGSQFMKLFGLYNNVPLLEEVPDITIEREK